jgi:tetratricopeptide (TPR) repeat protein
MRLLSLVVASSLVVPVLAQSPQDYVDRAVAAFEAGRGTEALAAFDSLVKLIPAVKPELWQRGIILYDLGRYKECAAQFAEFRTIVTDDVENTAWHYFCTAKAEGPLAARLALFRTGPDPRVMRAEVYAMLNGQLTPDQVIERAGTTPIALFYGHLYVGLYLEANGDAKAALAHLTSAADERYREYGGFMNITARVHRNTLARTVGR